tara:strand:- start:92 stop:493 length:402 start_codon:yes stop_codon:yes gene_type:complete
MKLNLYCTNIFKIFILIFILIFVHNKSLFAQDDINQKIKNISLQLRCMTCQNQSIYDSDADFSKDIKKIIKKQILEGKTEKEILNFLISRYGEYIVFKPLINYKNIFLWVFPFVIFGLSLVFFIIRLKKNQTK